MSFDNNLYYANQIIDIAGVSYRVTNITNSNSPFTSSVDAIIYGNVLNGAVTINLVNNTALPNRSVIIKKIDTTTTGNALTIVAPAGSTIDGVGSVTLTADGETIQLIRNGTLWNTISTSGGGGGGTVTSASNVGVGGVGPFDALVGTDLQFRNINSGSNKITVTNDVGNKEIDIDVNEANITLDNLGGTLSVVKGGTGSTSLTAGNVLVGDGINPVQTTKAAPVGVFVGTTDTQTLTNKTITDSTNNVTASGLKTTTTTVNIGSSVAPSAGQALIANSSSSATWQSFAGANTVTYDLIPVEAQASDVNFATIIYFPWLHARYSGYSGGTVVLNVTIINRNLDIRLEDIDNTTLLGSATYTTSGSKSFAITNPISDTKIAVRIRKSALAGSNPIIYGAVLEFSA